MSAKCIIFENASRTNGPKVFWQLRDFVFSLGYDGRFYLHDWLKQHRRKRSALCNFFSLDASDLRRSRRSLMTAPVGCATGFEVSEWTMSTLNLLFEMTSWCSWMIGKRRVKAETLLGSFLADSVHDSLGMVVLEPPTRAGRCCVDPFMPIGVCTSGGVGSSATPHCHCCCGASSRSLRNAWSANNGLRGSCGS